MQHQKHALQNQIVICLNKRIGPEDNTEIWKPTKPPLEIGNESSCV